MSKAIREAEKRARKREEAKRKTMLEYYKPLPSPPPRHSSNLEEEKWKAKAYFRAHAGYSESKERLMKFMGEAGIIHKEEVLQQMINERQIIYDPKAHMWQYTLKFIAAPEEEEGEGSSSNPDRKKVLELLSKLMADEIEAESKYRDAALVAHTAGFPALMRSLNVIASEEAIHRRKISDLISQLEMY